MAATRWERSRTRPTSPNPIRRRQCVEIWLRQGAGSVSLPYLLLVKSRTMLWKSASLFMLPFPTVKLRLAGQRRAPATGWSVLAEDGAHGRVLRRPRVSWRR